MIFYVATAVMAILKLVGLVWWSWWFVFAPALGYLAVIVVLYLIAFLFSVAAIALKMAKGVIVR